MRTVPTDSELYSKANMEILRNKLYQQTRQQLIGTYLITNARYKND